MTAAVVHFQCEQGSTFKRIITLSTGSTPTPMDLTGYSAKAQIRKFPLDATLVADLNATITDPTAGQITISLTAEQSQELPVGGLHYYETTALAYDLDLKDGTGVVMRILNGDFAVSPGVSR